MRIIDKNTDFYDYWQGIYRDDSIVFDRTDSFLLTKELMCDSVRPNYKWYIREDQKHFVLLQVCNTFWLFLVEVTKQDQYGSALDYTIELVASWKNYSKERCLERLDVISFGVGVDRFFEIYDRGFGWKYDKEKILNKPDVLVDAVNRNDFRVERSINKHTVYKGDNTKEEKHIPLLKACGIGSLVDPLEIYLAFEEYFSLEKTSSERTESVGLSNDEKIGNHGFDKKTSFRGK